MATKKKIVLGKGLSNFEVAGKPTSSKFVDVKWGLIDFSSMTEKQAKHLIKNGFPYLREKGTAKSGGKNQ